MKKYITKQSSIKGAGKGLFTKDFFKKGEVIGLAHVNGQPTKEIGSNHNHNEKNPTANNIKNGNKRYLIASRNLKPGEEITTNYRLQPELEQPEDFKKKKDKTMTPQKDGYRTYSPFKNLPYIDVESDTIDSDNIVYDLKLRANNGLTKFIKKNTGLHTLPGAKVIREIPVKRKGGSLLTKEVTCKSCGWKWDAEDGGKDITTCHKCGGQGLVHAQGGGAPQCPEEWEAEIRAIEDQIGSPDQWSLKGYNLLQNKLNQYRDWRENTPEGQAVMDSHNVEGEYNVPVPEHLQDYTNAMMKSRLAYANEFGNPAAKRMINLPDNPYQFDNGDTGSHYMASMDNYAVPQIQDENGVLQLGDYGPESNEAIRFDSDEDANYFAKNYKDVSPGFIEADLDEDEIEEYRKGGYIVEEIDTYQKGGPTKLKYKKPQGASVQPPIQKILKNPSAVLKWSKEQDAKNLIKKEKIEEQKALEKAKNALIYDKIKKLEDFETLEANELKKPEHLQFKPDIYFIPGSFSNSYNPNNNIPISDNTNIYRQPIITDWWLDPKYQNNLNLFIAKQRFENAKAVVRKENDSYLKEGLVNNDGTVETVGQYNRRKEKYDNLNLLGKMIENDPADNYKPQPIGRSPFEDSPMTGIGGAPKIILKAGKWLKPFWTGTKNVTQPFRQATVSALKAPLPLGKTITNATAGKLNLGNSVVAYFGADALYNQGNPKSDVVKSQSNFINNPSWNTLGNASFETGINSLGFLGLGLGKQVFKPIYNASKNLIKRFKGVPKKLPGFPNVSMSTNPLLTEHIPPNYTSKADYVEDFANTVDNFIRQHTPKLINDLSSKEGIRRLSAQFKKADPTLSDDAIAELVKNRLIAVENSLMLNRGKWIKEMVKRKDVFEQEQFLNDILLKDYFPLNNAYYNNNSLFKHAPKVSNTGSTNNSNIINLVKTDKPTFLDNDPTGGYITLGKGHENSLGTLTHEAGHAVQKGSPLPFETELQSIYKTVRKNPFNLKSYADDLYRALTSKSLGQTNESLDYFLTGSNKKEAYPFIREFKENMIRNRIIKNVHDEITFNKLLKAKLKIKPNTEDSRLLDITPPWDWKRLSKAMNEAPAIVPIGIGLGAASQIPQNKYGGLHKFLEGGEPPCGPDETIDPQTGLCIKTLYFPEVITHSDPKTRKLQGNLMEQYSQVRNAFNSARKNNSENSNNTNYSLGLGESTDTKKLPGFIKKYQNALELEKIQAARNKNTLSDLQKYDPETWKNKKAINARSTEGLASLRNAVKSGAMSQEDFMYAYNDWGKDFDQNAVQGTGPGAVYNNKDADEIWGDDMNKEFFKPLAYGITGALGVIGGGIAAPGIITALSNPYVSGALTAYGITEGTKEFLDPNSVTRQSMSKAWDDPTASNIGNATWDTSLNALNYVGVPFLKPIGKAINSSKNLLKGGKNLINKNLINKSILYKSKNAGRNTSTGLTEADIAAAIAEEKAWINSPAYLKRRMANTSETTQQIKNDVIKINKRADNATYNVNANIDTEGSMTNSIFGKPQVSVSTNALNPKQVLGHENIHLYSPASETETIFSKNLHKNWDNPNVENLPASEKGVYANYPTIGDAPESVAYSDVTDYDYNMLGHEQQTRQLNASREIAKKNNVNLNAGEELTEQQVRNHMDDFINTRKDVDYDYDATWTAEINKEQLKLANEFGTPLDVLKESNPNKYKEILKLAKDNASKTITKVLNNAWVTVPIGTAGTATMFANPSESNDLQKQKQGGTTNDYVDVDLTPEEIKDLIAQGYIIEELN